MQYLDIYVGFEVVAILAVSRDQRRCNKPLLCRSIGHYVPDLWFNVVVVVDWYLGESVRVGCWAIWERSKDGGQELNGDFATLCFLVQLGLQSVGNKVAKTRSYSCKGL